MNINQLQKIINDYRNQRCAIDLNLAQLEQQRKALISRKKFITRKINILNEKIDKTTTDEINWSCDDFDNLDMLS